MASNAIQNADLHHFSLSVLACVTTDFVPRSSIVSVNAFFSKTESGKPSSAFGSRSTKEEFYITLSLRKKKCNRNKV
jgi:hypothetical protein